ncbi:MAG: late competence development ComFB family protein [Defluviitaleaceae bacterium]|nr:late competence development ComFB family protein [Defluviitaleaceae bacterium]
MPDVCDCERCRLDIFALAMNNCPPKYIVTQRGSIYSRLNILQNQFAVDVMRAVTDAAIRVGESPRHNKEEEIYIQ